MSYLLQRLTRRKTVRVASRAFLIFAIYVYPGYLCAGEGEEAAASDRAKKAKLPPAPEPVYNLPRDARDPFMRPWEAQPEVKKAEKPASDVTVDDLRKSLRLTMVMSVRGRPPVATVNEKLFTVGDELRVTVGNVQVTLVCKEIREDPPAVVFTWKEKKKSVTIGLRRPQP